MIRLVMEFPDGDRKEIATLAADSLSPQSFADHLVRVADILSDMAVGWRDRCQVDEQFAEIASRLDLDPQP